MVVSRICFGQWQPVKQEQNYSGYSQKKAFEKSMQEILKESNVKEVFLTTFLTVRKELNFFQNLFTITFKHSFAGSTRLKTIIYWAVNKETLTQRCCRLSVTWLYESGSIPLWDPRRTPVWQKLLWDFITFGKVHCLHFGEGYLLDGSAS